MKLEDRLASLKALTTLSGVNIPVMEVCHDWLLLTYDIPCNDIGNKTRRKFLSMAKAIGASQHTLSVYLLPWTPESELLAVEVAAVGNAFIWTSNVKDLQKAKELTKAYDADIASRIVKLDKRIDKIETAIIADRKKDAHRMIEKTERMIKELRKIVTLRASQELLDKFEKVSQRLLDIFSVAQQTGSEDSHAD